MTRIDEFPVHTCKYKILPSLVSALEFGTGLSCFAALLASTLKIGAMLSPDEYNDTVIPAVVKLFSSNEVTIIQSHRPIPSNTVLSCMMMNDGCGCVIAIHSCASVTTFGRLCESFEQRTGER